MVISEGLEVYYNGIPGTVRFVSEQYFTVCIARFDSKVRDVCILVYPEKLDRVSLMKESTK
jgi:hypothetical protein